MSCQDVLEMVMLAIPTNIIIATMNGATGCFPAEVVSCLQTAGAPGAVISAAQTKQ